MTREREQLYDTLQEKKKEILKLQNIIEDNREYIIQRRAISKTYVCQNYVCQNYNIPIRNYFFTTAIHNVPNFNLLFSFYHRYLMTIQYLSVII